MQRYKSAGTSINSTRVPALFKKIPWCNSNAIKKNVDLGGGRYDTATKYLAEFGVKNVIYDPFNRDFRHNLNVVMDMAINRADTATISNTLNVIRERGKRIELLRCAKRWAEVVFISVYEGDKTGTGRQTKKGCWQENRKLEDYIPEVFEVFENVRIEKGMIIAWADNNPA